MGQRVTGIDACLNVDEETVCHVYCSVSTQDSICTESNGKLLNRDEFHTGIDNGNKSERDYVFITSAR